MGFYLFSSSVRSFVSSILMLFYSLLTKLETFFKYVHVLLCVVFCGRKRPRRQLPLFSRLSYSVVYIGEHVHLKLLLSHSTDTVVYRMSVWNVNRKCWFCILRRIKK